MDITWVTLILSLFGQLGDLVESGFKRHFGVKTQVEYLDTVVF